MKKNNFLSYVIDNYYNQIFRALKEYILDHQEELILDKFDDATKIDEDLEIEFNEIGAHVEPLDLDYIAIDIVMIPDIQASVYHAGKYKSYESETVRLGKVIIECSAKFDETINGFTVLDVYEYQYKKYDKPLNGDLVPIISKKEYDDIATNFLKSYFPLALNGEIPNPYKIVKAMGLKLIRRKINKDDTIFGEIFFKKSKASFYDVFKDEYVEEEVEANTIVIDDLAMCLYSFGTIGLTIIHECLHYYLHRKAFIFSQIYNKDITKIACSMNGIIDASHDDRSKWMEIQANGIAPCVLMPKDSFIKNYEIELIDVQRLYGSKFEDYAPHVIENLADKYGVTKYAVKKRLIDLGYISAKGVFDYVDNKYIKPYLFAKDSLKEGETYTVSFDDLSKSNVTSLLALMFAGDYRFIENHLILNEKKYITEEGELTDYARVHLDECAVRFKITAKDKSFDNISSSLVTFCYLCREIREDMTYEIVSVKAPETIPDIKKAREESQARIADMIREMSTYNTFREKLYYLMKQFKVNKASLIRRSKLSEKTISRYLDEKGKEKQFDIRCIVSICLSFNLPPKLSDILINFTCGGIRPTPEGDALRTILCYMYDKSVDEANQYLIMQGFKPLIKIEE